MAFPHYSVTTAWIDVIMLQKQTRQMNNRHYNNVTTAAVNPGGVFEKSAHCQHSISISADLYISFHY